MLEIAFSTDISYLQKWQQLLFIKHPEQIRKPCKKRKIIINNWLFPSMSWIFEQLQSWAAI